MRYGLEPGDSLPLGKVIGSFVTHVETGELTLSSDQPLTASMPGRAATPGAPAASPAAGALETVLQPGDAVLISQGTMLSIANDADEPATFLVVLMYAAEREAEPGAGGGEPVGLTQQAISMAPAGFPARRGTLTMERVVVEPGDTLENDSGHGMGINGIELGGIEQGSVEATFEMGSSWRWPDILNEDNPQQPIDAGATIDLVAGDGYWTFDGSSTWNVTGNEPPVLLRVVVMPGR